MSETTKLRKIGNSSGINLPKKVIEALELKLGEELYLSIEHNCLIIRKAPPSLKELLKTVPKNEKASELDCGDNIGREVIDDE
ncbi:MAG: AbrB/MazE/SpoVT family DNA-binding domain-containing protein [Oligoflexales bacterium]|nr:AbrB/MazE/SpoVT family DNA-binding domain-containing protein [Oligoflexales bacterium]